MKLMPTSLAGVLVIEAKVFADPRGYFMKTHHLSDQNHPQIFVPAGFAHGFCVLSETAHALHKCTDFYARPDEKGVLWSDPDIGIHRPVKDPVVSEKDGGYPRVSDIAPGGLFVSGVRP